MKTYFSIPTAAIFIFIFIPFIAEAKGVMPQRTIIVDYAPIASPMLYENLFNDVQVKFGDQQIYLDGKRAAKQSAKANQAVTQFYVTTSRCLKIVCERGPQDLISSCSSQDPESSADCSYEDTQTQKRTYTPASTEKTIRFKYHNGVLTINEE